MKNVVLFFPYLINLKAFVITEELNGVAIHSADSFLRVMLVLLQACKKNDLSNNLNPSPTTGGSNSASALKDTTINYSRDIYLWYNQIPTGFNAQSYADPNAIMEGIRQYSTELGFSTPVDKWSFAMKKNEWDNLSSGVSGDFGMNVFFF